MPTLWQLCAILAALGLSFFTNQIIKNYVVGSAVNNWKIATDGLIRIISPIIILIVLFLLKNIFRYFSDNFNFTYCY